MASRRPTKLNEEELWDYALRILAQKAYSAGEIRQKLLLRTADPAFVSATLMKLKQYGLADDDKFSEVYAQSLLRNKGFGRSRVLRDLRAKQVPAKTAEKAIDKTFEGTSETELIENFLARKFRSKNLTAYLQEDKNVASVYRKLRLAGFSGSASLAALRSHARRTADWEITDEPQFEPDA